MSGVITDFVDRKISIANALYNGEAFGGYEEGILILLATISAIASEVWPGHKKDARRFVELLVRFSDINPSPRTISVPFLLDILERNYQNVNGFHYELSALSKELIPFFKNEILTGTDLDFSEVQILSILNDLEIQIPLAFIREASYAFILYSELRCSLFHEYFTGIRVDNFKMTNRTTAVSYNNYSCNSDNKLNNGIISRKLYFHFDWLVETICSIAKNVEPVYQNGGFPDFKDWWLPGKQERTSLKNRKNH